jgi:predicted Zn finger-like uncharacterized protein
MSVRVVCSACGTAYQVADHLLGKKVKCRQCQQVIPVPATPTPAPAAPPAKAVTPPAEDAPFVLPAGAAEGKREAPARPARKARPPKGRSTPLLILAGALAVLVLLGGAGVAAWVVYSTYFSHKDETRPAQLGVPPWMADNPFAGPDDEEPLIPRQDRLAAHFLAPEELPPHGLEFAEPPPDSDGEAPKLIKNATGQLTPAVLRKIKESTVYIRSHTDQGDSEGSGFFAGEPGFVITNAHVVGMLARGTPAPTNLKVVRNKGEKNAATFPAKVVAVDHDADLAVLSVPKEGAAPPLLVKSALALQETQPVYVAGFPLGESLGKSITINKYDLSSLKKVNGALEKLQVHGDMQPGNSGGPLLDADGEVVGVCVAILRNTRINFAIPGDKVLRFLTGHLDDLALGPPARVDGSLRVPVSAFLTDPLKRVRRVSLDLWVGKPGPARPGSRTAPKPEPGDGPRQTLELAVQQQAGRGELTLPPLPAGQAYWLQPSLVSGGGRVWLSAQVYRPAAPVERKPARLALKPAGEWPLTLQRWSEVHFPDPRGADHRALVRAEARLKDVFRGAQGGVLDVYRQFTAFKEGVSLDGEVRMTRALEHLAPNVQFLAARRLLDERGAAKPDAVDSVLLQQASPAGQRVMIAFGDQMIRSVHGLDVALPGAEVQPGATWTAHRPLPIDPAWPTVTGLPSAIWEPIRGDALEVTFTYAGTRTVNGAEQAVLSLHGRVAPAAEGVPSAGGSGGRLSGTAVVDLATGQVVEEEVTTRANLELVLPLRTAIQAQGTVLTRLRRE